VLNFALVIPAMQNVTRLLRPAIAIPWLVTVLLAGYFGYHLRATSADSTAYRKTPFAAASSVQQVSPAAAAGTEERPAEESLRLWPAGVPENGPALRDYVAAVLRNPDPVERQFRYLQLLRAATKEQSKALYEGWDLLRKEGSERHECHVPMNFRNGQLDGPGTAGVRTGSTYDTSVANHVAIQLEGWLSADPAGARAWVSGLQDGPFREKMIATYVVAAGLQNLSEAPELVAQLPEDIQAAVGKRMAARMRENGGLSTALDTLTSMKTGPDQQPPAWAIRGAQDLLEEGLRARQRAGGVAAVMAQKLDLAVVTPERLTAIGRNYVTENPEGALTWAAGVEGSGSAKAPPGSLMGPLVEAAFEDKLPVIEAWLEKQPELPGRDNALLALSLRLSATDPAKAALLASRIKDDTLRSQATQPAN
jgi:hypothetical protein